MSTQNQRIGIIGAGAIAHGLAAILEEDHTVTLWSPSGRDLLKKISVIGEVNKTFTLNIANSAKELAENHEVLIFALPVNGHKSTIDAISPYLHENHHIIISSYASFSALYLQNILNQRSLCLPISAWNTTALTAKLYTKDTLTINTIRNAIEMHTIPKERMRDELALCESLFGDKFIEKPSLLAITLSNLNPQLHMGMALCNITRMEQAEVWCQRKNVTPSVGRLIEALDKERLDIAAAFGLSVKSIFDHYKVGPENNVSAINQALHAKKPIWGPKTTDSRYISEDVPYGLYVTSKLGRYIGKPALLHESGVQLFSTLCGEDFPSENKLLAELGFDKLTLEEISQ